MRALPWLSVLLAGCAACSQSRPTLRPPPALVKAGGIELGRDAQGRPTVALRIGQKWARLLVDSGASTHVLALDFLREALGQEPRGEPLPVNGIVGSEQPALLVDEIQGQTHEGVTLSLQAPVVMAYARDGDDGLLAPQLLALSQDVELDLPHDRLTLNPEPDAAARDLGATRCEPYDNLSVLFVAPVTVNGSPAPLLLDTGATYSALDAESDLGAKLLSHSAPAGRVRGLGGGASSRSVQARIGFGGREFSNELRLVGGRAQGCEAVGHLGNDLLGDCRLRFGPSSVAASCAEPSPVR